MTAGHWKRLATSWVLLAAILLVAGGLLALIGSTVLPGAGLFVWATVGLLGFLFVQLVLFRLLGLRSRADEQAEPAARAARPAADTELPSSVEVGAEESAEPEASDARAASSEDDTRRRDWRAWRG